MRDAVIVEAVRSAHGKRNGTLSEVHPVNLLADVLSALVTRAGLDPELVDDVVIGCVGQIGDQSSNVARFAVLAAGWPQAIPGVTVNRACGSSQQALDYAAYRDHGRAGRHRHRGRSGVDDAGAAGRLAPDRLPLRAAGARRATTTSRSTRASAPR